MKFIKCDRCGAQDTIMGTVSLPPGWEKVLGRELCEPCCHIVREFISFSPADAAKLPVEPVETGPAPPVDPTGVKLFETAPENPTMSDTGDAGNVVAQIASDAVPIEASTEERAKTRKAKRTKLAGQDAILPDKRSSFPHGHNAEGPAPAPPTGGPTA